VVYLRSNGNCRADLAVLGGGGTLVVAGCGTPLASGSASGDGGAGGSLSLCPRVGNADGDFGGLDPGGATGAVDPGRRCVGASSASQLPGV
jgi:hypothetical protein